MAKATKRAKRLGKYLETALGWEVFESLFVCSNSDCPYTSSTEGFCKRCGSELYVYKSVKLAVLHDLEYAIQYALKEPDAPDLDYTTRL